MANASVKKVVGTISVSGKAKGEDGRIGLAPKATPPSLIIIAASVALITFAVFLPALQNEFVNWDDNVYVYENSFIRTVNAKLFKSAFLGFYASNWHPLTWLSHAMDYAIWGLNPLGHHLTNIILHAFNVLIVVFLVTRLTEVVKKTATHNRLSGTFLNDRTILITATVTGLLFGLHPVHVESVVWVAERKDLLCASFLLLSLTAYMKYAHGQENKTVQSNSVARFFDKQYLFTMGFFILALLSKPMAVALPIVLLIMDLHPFNRIRSVKTFGTAFVEKIPFIALSVISSILTILAQSGRCYAIDGVCTVVDTRASGSEITCRLSLEDDITSESQPILSIPRGRISCIFGVSFADDSCDRYYNNLYGRCTKAETLAVSLVLLCSNTNSCAWHCSGGGPGNG
jgi:hypothetical protein